MDKEANMMPINTENSIILENNLIEANPINILNKINDETNEVTGIVEGFNKKSKVVFNNPNSVLTPFDIEVCGAILKLWSIKDYDDFGNIMKGNENSDDCVCFNERQIVKVLSCTEGGRQYRNVRESLERLITTELVIVNFKTLMEDGEIARSNVRMRIFQTVTEIKVEGNQDKVHKWRLNTDIYNSLKIGYWSVYETVYRKVLSSPISHILYRYFNSTLPKNFEEEFNNKIPLQVLVSYCRIDDSNEYRRRKKIIDGINELKENFPEKFGNFEVIKNKKEYFLNVIG